MHKSIIHTVVIFSLCSFAGCNNSSQTIPTKESANVATTEDRHEGWWCAEHGVPEEACALCSSKVAAELRAKGDWCQNHDRPESQCFICHPEKTAEFAALYEAKYGQQPPRLEE
jgi:hypothetical protein